MKLWTYFDRREKKGFRAIFKKHIISRKMFVFLPNRLAGNWHYEGDYGWGNWVAVGLRCAKKKRSERMTSLIALLISLLTIGGSALTLRLIDESKQAEIESTKILIVHEMARKGFGSAIVEISGDYHKGFDCTITGNHFARHHGPSSRKACFEAINDIDRDALKKANKLLRSVW